MLHSKGSKAYDSRIWGKIGASWLSGFTGWGPIGDCFFLGLGLRGGFEAKP